jgi:cell division protease FtsH
VKKSRGLGVYLLIVAIVFVMWMLSTTRTTSNCDYQTLEHAVKNDTLKNVKIIQNAQVPTGSVEFELKGKSDKGKIIAVTPDVNKIEKLFQDHDISYVVQDVPKDGWMQTLLPMIIVVAVMFILFMAIINGQNMAMQGGQSGGNRMSDFGKSRAQKTNADQMTIRFKDVAGLK